MAEISNQLRTLREKRGIPAAQLARSVGVTRQTIYAIEAGDFVPNTAVALRMARELGVAVEDLFSLAALEEAPAVRGEQSVPLPGSPLSEPGQPVQLCRVGGRLISSPPSTVPWFLPSADAVLSRQPSRKGKAAVELFHPDEDFEKRILIAGCDPGFSVLARHVRAAGIELVLAHRNSSQALALLKEGCIHIAGTHLRDEAGGEPDLSAIGHVFPRKSVSVISLAVWEQGLVVAKGNPKGIRGVADLARPGVTIVNREPGAGSRSLLDYQLKKLTLRSEAIRGYDCIAAGHLQAASQVESGAADACVATLAAARLFGLDFLPLASERYDLVIRREHLDLPPMRILLDTLSQARYRRELERLGGYDTRETGQRRL